jgi:hypothetical protein
MIAKNKIPVTFHVIDPPALSTSSLRSLVYIYGTYIHTSE